MKLGTSKEKIDKMMTEAFFKFSIKCLDKYIKIKPKSNYAFSPLNLYEALFLVYLTSSGVFEQYLKEILFLTKISKDDLINSINFDKYSSNLIGQVSSSDDPQLQTNAPAAACDYENGSMGLFVKSKFSANHKLMRKIFKNGFYHFDDNTKENLCKTNKQIQLLTNNYIVDPVQLITNYAGLEIILTSVLCFNQKFQTNGSLNERKCKNFFSVKLSAVVSEFPYQNNNISLFIFLSASKISDSPKRIKLNKSSSKFNNFIRLLSSDEGIYELNNLLNNDTIKINVKTFSFRPNFEMEKDLKFRELLQALGVQELLMHYPIDLDNNFFKSNEQQVHYGDVAHRTHVKVTKESTLVGAMTLLSGEGSVSKVVSKSANVSAKYPYLWIIYDKQQQDILCTGVCKKSTF
ncbi:leukocyte elastase inhibitor-like [Nylanderia fulva]|uniref:leukocyte elastase inhibitor-like n=1 Tax=Nylanderia fulva TaxID=613905 RepID=UPI0010FAEC47|nr:leukocyte elastase inhibitor-like [Nylanderia fulva]